MKKFSQYINESNDNRDIVQSLQLPAGDSPLTDRQLNDFAKRSHAFRRMPSSPLHISANNDIENMGIVRLKQVIAHPKVNVFYKHKARVRLAELGGIAEETQKSAYLEEALIDVDASDINKIYEPLRQPTKELMAIFSKDPSTISRHDFLEVISQYVSSYVITPIKTISSKELKSSTAKAANDINPISIKVYLFAPKGSRYLMKDSGATIEVGLPNEFMDFLNQSNLQFSSNASMYLQYMKNSITDVRVKSTIRHELTHWLDDSLHNMHLTKNAKAFNALIKTGPAKDVQDFYTKAVAHGEKDIYLAPLEITAAVNQIAEVKRRIGEKRYNNLTWADLMEMVPSLGNLNARLGAEWRKRMFTRLARENLVGTNLTKNLESALINSLRKDYAGK